MSNNVYITFGDVKDNYKTLSKLELKQLKLFIDSTNKLYNLGWTQAFSNGKENGLEKRKDNNKNYKLPLDVNDKYYIWRVSRSFRLIGYRCNEFFCIVKIDPNHKEDK